ncbi:hypothetical protein [Portibacter marinus]|uniref:hypothetical protein n=1 Tax=Portibacter marinus TaxID=2898660 RepID=UPI001F1A2BE2|nr:hypothetical protein [Portibacter marinus]
MTGKKTNHDLVSQLEKHESERIRLEKLAGKHMLWYILVPIVFIGCLVLFDEYLPTMLFTAILVAMFYGFYYLNVQEPFNKIVSQIRKSLLAEYIRTYYPELKYEYSRIGRSAKEIIQQTNLINANKFEEEDVITGEINDVEFYLSEISAIRKVETLKFPLFKGILFKLKIPNKEFPYTTIQSKLGLIKKNFGGIEKNEQYQFWISSDDKTKINEQLNTLYPFFKHLIKDGRDVRIYAEKDEIVLMMDVTAP